MAGETAAISGYLWAMVNTRVFAFCLQLRKSHLERTCSFKFYLLKNFEVFLIINERINCEAAASRLCSCLFRFLDLGKCSLYLEPITITEQYVTFRDKKELTEIKQILQDARTKKRYNARTP